MAESFDDLRARLPPGYGMSLGKNFLEITYGNGKDRGIVGRYPFGTQFSIVEQDIAYNEARLRRQAGI